MESKKIYWIEQRSSSSEENLSPEKKKPRSEQISSSDSSGLGQICSDSSQEEEKNKQKLEQISSDSSQEEEKIKYKLEQISSSSDSSQDEEKNKLKISDSSPEEKENKQKLECIHSDLSSGDSDSEDSDSEDSEDSGDSDSEDSEDPEATEEREAVEALENTRMKNKKKFELPKEKLKTHGWYGIVMASAGDEYSDAEERAEDMLKYYEQVEKSGGFDVGHFPKARVCGMIGPVRVKGSGSLEDEPLLGKLSCSAIDKFNRDHGREYQFNKVIKSTGRGCAGMVYYITFEAKEADSATIFEASVHRMIGGKVKILKIDTKVV